MPAWMSVRWTVGAGLVGMLGVGWSMPGWAEQPTVQPTQNGVLRFIENYPLGDRGLDTGGLEATSDVHPQDWAYRALRSLVERSGCIQGIPEAQVPQGYLQGDRPANRVLLATTFNVCIDRLNELLASSDVDGVSLFSQEDIALIQCLYQEFWEELVILRNRTDYMGPRSDESGEPEPNLCSSFQ